jgi:putative oxygen-independent coproporphyrinogen III oxidase
MSSRRPPFSRLRDLRPDDVRLADAAEGWRSAYVHIPFCLRRCPYCDFAIVDESAVGRSDVDRYVDAVVAEIGMERSFGPLDAINFGGGTPTRLEAQQLASIVDALDHQFGLDDAVEVSLEANPEDWTQELAADLVDAGFNRVSIGAQSFDDGVLAALGRNHDAASVASTVRSARDGGFPSVSLDLIFGHPSESDASWDRSVRSAISLEPDHISTYSLTVEPGTVLSRQVLGGQPEPDPDTQASRYERFVALAEPEGIIRYELSNHARTGHVCRYNLATWSHAEYVAFGLGAHDHRDGRRARNHRRIDRYLTDVEAGVRPRLGSEKIDAATAAVDRLMLGLRLSSGVAIDDAARRFIASPPGQRLIDAGIMAVHEARLVVLEPMMTDAVVREALSVSSGDC